MLEPGERIPEARVWAEERGGPVLLREALSGEGLALLCFYPLDWSPG
jgi:hypothetical protein